MLYKYWLKNTASMADRIIIQIFTILFVHFLASNSYDKRQVAARTLGDLVKKLGERVLPEIIPILEKGKLFALFFGIVKVFLMLLINCLFTFQAYRLQLQKNAKEFVLDFLKLCLRLLEIWFCHL